MTHGLSRLACATWVLWLAAGCGAGRARTAEPRRTVYYVADTDQRPGNLARRRDAIRSIERDCPQGYDVEAERPPSRRHRTGSIRYSCRGDAR